MKVLAWLKNFFTWNARKKRLRAIEIFAQASAPLLMLFGKVGAAKAAEAIAVASDKIADKIEETQNENHD